MARLAAALQPATDTAPPIALARAAVAMARRLEDPACLHATLGAACSALLDLADADEVHALCREYAALSEQCGSATESFRAYQRLAMTAYSVGEVSAAKAAVARAGQLAERLGQPHFGWRAAALEAMRALFLGDFSRADALRAEASALAARAGDPNATRTLALQHIAQLRMQGHWDACLRQIDQLRDLFSGLPLPQQSIAVYEASTLARAGRSAELQAHLRSTTIRLSDWRFDHTMLEVIVDVCVAQGDRELAQSLYTENALHPDRALTGGVFGLSWDTPVAGVLARLARFLGDGEKAQSLYERALRFVRDHGARAHEAWLALEYAEWLVERGRSDAAREELQRVQVLGQALELTNILQRAGDLRQLAEAEPAAQAKSEPVSAGSVHFTLEREGDYWALHCAERTFRLKDSKGLGMLSRLLAEPGRELHVLDLSSETGAADSGDAGELLDPRARAAYAQRVRDLREESEEAQAHGDLARAERARDELDAIAAELSRAVGAGGRGRRAGSAVERARVNVQRRLRDALARIREHDPALARHLERALRTGTFCCYRTD